MRVGAPRLVPEEPFPPYTFVPGLHPHPESDPAGHSFGRERVEAPALDPAQWQASRPYLRGLDLFNAGFYWESHVEWESLWLAAGRRGPVANFLQGLIHLAAGGVKRLAGNGAGVKSHATRAAERWRKMAGEEVFAGLCVRELIDLAEAIQREGWPGEVPVLLPVPPRSSGK
jgi:hypothetical protein